jgi:hypothetical protein
VPIHFRFLRSVSFWWHSGNFSKAFSTPVSQIYKPSSCTTWYLSLSFHVFPNRNSPRHVLVQTVKPAVLRWRSPLVFLSPWCGICPTSELFSGWYPYCSSLSLLSSWHCTIGGSGCPRPSQVKLNELRVCLLSLQTAYYP